MAQPQQRREYDVCIVGAGPGGLATLSAVCEPYSVDDLSFDQADRASRTRPDERPSVCVVDPLPWMSGWRERFKSLGIGWLRSPAMAHPDAFDAWSLTAFAHSHGRGAELRPTAAQSWKPIKGLGSAQAGLFNLPSSELFLDFCDELAKKLPHTFIPSKAVSVSGTDGDFTVALSDGSAIAAKAVVLALGVPGPPAVPPAFKDLPPDIAFHTEEGQRLRELPRGRRVLVIGGGLTAVQAAQLAMQRGCAVSLCSRRRLTTRSFDIPVEWFDPRQQARLRHDFFSLPSEERLLHLRATKGGGSVPPFYMEQLRAAEAARKVEVVCGEAKVLSVPPAAGGAGGPGGVEVELAGTSRHFHHIILACGHRPDCKALPLLRELQTQCPVPIVGGLPDLTKDLQWGSYQNLYLVGALSALQVGPDAASLMGCRRAAQVVAQSLGLRLWLRSSKPRDGSISICGNRFQCFSDSDTDDETTDAASVGSPLDGDSVGMTSDVS